MEMERYTQCSKNPQHERFIPVKEFSEVHLPSLLTPPDKSKVCDVVRQLADLTVRITVSHCDGKRPLQEAYVYPKPRRLRIMGTGWIQSVQEALKGERCPCLQCMSGLGSSSQHWFTVRVTTACHVVYDIEEAKSAVVDLFYDDDEESKPSTSEKVLDDISRTNWRKTRQLQCIGLFRSDLNRDVAILKCVSHDEEIYHRLQAALGLLSRQVIKLEQNISGGKFGRHQFCEPNFAVARKMPWEGSLQQSMVVIVSHPHGLPKMVSVGVFRGKIFRNYFEGQCQSYIEAAKRDDDLMDFLNRMPQGLTIRERLFNKDIWDCALLKIIEEGKNSSCCQAPKEDYTVRLRNCPNCVCFSDQTRSSADFRYTGAAIANLLNLSVRDCHQMSDEDSLNPSLEETDKRNPGNRDFTSEPSFTNPPKQPSVSFNTGTEVAGLQKVLLHMKYVIQENQQPRCNSLYMPVYNTPTCPGSSGAPVFIYPPSKSRGNRQKCKISYKSLEKPNVCDTFYTHSTWSGAGAGCGMRPPCQDDKTPPLKLDTSSHNFSWCHSCDCEEPIAQPCQNQGGNKKVEYRSIIDCPGPPTQSVDKQENSSGSLLQGALKVLNDALKKLYNNIWSSPNNAKRLKGESDMDNIMVPVVFPNGETKFCLIYFNTRLVKEEKARLLMDEMNEDYRPPDHYYLLLSAANNAESPFTMDDEVEILQYFDDLADDAKIVFVLKQEEEILEIGPDLGVKLKL